MLSNGKDEIKTQIQTKHVIVSNIPANTTQMQLSQLFMQHIGTCGPIDMIPINGNLVQIGVIEFSSYADAEKAIRIMDKLSVGDGQQLVVRVETSLDNEIIKMIKWGIPAHEVTQIMTQKIAKLLDQCNIQGPVTNIVRVNNLPPNLTQLEVKETFGAAGHIVEDSFMNERFGASALIRYEYEYEAMQTFILFDGKSLRGQRLRINFEREWSNNRNNTEQRFNDNAFGSGPAPSGQKPGLLGDGLGAPLGGYVVPRLLGDDRDRDQRSSTHRRNDHQDRLLSGNRDGLDFGNRDSFSGDRRDGLFSGNRDSFSGDLSGRISGNRREVEGADRMGNRRQAPGLLGDSVLSSGINSLFSGRDDSDRDVFDEMERNYGQEFGHRDRKRPSRWEDEDRKAKREALANPSTDVQTKIKSAMDGLQQLVSSGVLNQEQLLTVTTVVGQSLLSLGGSIAQLPGTSSSSIEDQYLANQFDRRDQQSSSNQFQGNSAIVRKSIFGDRAATPDRNEAPNHNSGSSRNNMRSAPIQSLLNNCRFTDMPPASLGTNQNMKKGLLGDGLFSGGMIGNPGSGLPGLMSQSRGPHTDDIQDRMSSGEMGQKSSVVMVRFLPAETAKEDVQKLFKSCGNIKSVDLQMRDGKYRGIIRFFSPLSADKAVSQLNGSFFKGEKIKVEFN